MSYITALWETDNCSDLFDHIFNSIISNSEQDPEYMKIAALSKSYVIKWSDRYLLREILGHISEKQIIEQQQKAWILHLINSYSADILRMNALFYMCAEMPSDFRRSMFAAFLKNNSDFKHLICFRLSQTL